MRLLLAEDEHGLTRALTAILTHEGMYEVDVVENGAAAYEKLLTGTYDAAILDIMMPGIDGIEVVRRVRARGVRTPIIMLTARGEVSDKVTALDAGANDYLTKPFSALELLARIRVLTRAATALDARTLAVGNVRLDLMSCMLTGPEGTVHLSNREFQLMSLLMARPGKRMPTERLFNEIWGSDALEELNVVWVQVSNLRKRLAAIGADIGINASRNQGYALEPIQDSR